LNNAIGVTNSLAVFEQPGMRGDGAQGIDVARWRRYNQNGQEKEQGMAELTIHEALWHDFVAVAEQQKQAPQDLAQQVLRDYIQRASDEQLLARSAHAARRAKLRIGDAEEAVRQYRRRKATGG
jgi:hypothetical protein